MKITFDLKQICDLDLKHDDIVKNIQIEQFDNKGLIIKLPSEAETLDDLYECIPNFYLEIWNNQLRLVAYDTNHCQDDDPEVFILHDFETKQGERK